jgi:hypothetical protein
MSLQTRLSALITAIKGDFDGLDTRITALEGAGGGGGALFPIWAEENGALASNQYEWSWGNGATGSAIGLVVPVDCDLVAFTHNVEVAGTSIFYRVQQNGTNVHTTGSITAANYTENVDPAVAFSAGDRVSFQTGTVSGSWSDGRVCAWFREA